MFSKQGAVRDVMKILKRLSAIMAIAAVALIGFGGLGMIGAVKAEAEPKEIAWTDFGISETESTEEITNPERGFYQSLSYKLGGGHDWWWNAGSLADYVNRDKRGILHFRFGLEKYSSNAGGSDGLISQSDLDDLNELFGLVRQAGATAFIRFSYDSVGNLGNAEPDMAQIKQHIAQLGALINENLDVIALVETGMIGPWGEQHTTTLGSQMIDGSTGVTYELVNAWLKAVDGSRTVNVRRPVYYVLWAQRAYPDLGITIDNLHTKADAIKSLGGEALRVGVFNDGYLGNALDFGTYSNREKEVSFLDFLASYTLFGGEVITDSKVAENELKVDPTLALNDWNNAQFISKEGYKTHTSYLNVAWNNYVVASWERTTMSGLTGSDAIYNGKDGKLFVSNRLGYRLLLKDAQTASCGKGGIAGIRGKVENVGFGNTVNEKTATVILRNGSASYSAEVGIDIRKARSGGEALEYERYFRIPSNAPEGNYDIFIRFADAHEKSKSAARTIKFANEGMRFDAATGGNYVGSITVTNEKESDETEFKEVETPTETPDKPIGGGDGDNTGDGDNSGDGDSSGGNEGGDNGNTVPGDTDKTDPTPEKKGCFGTLWTAFAIAVASLGLAAVKFGRTM